MLLKTATNANITSANRITTQPTNEAGAYLAAGGRACIGVHLVDRQPRNDGTYSPAHIKLTEHPSNNASNVCRQVIRSQVVTDYFNSTVPGAGAATDPITAAIPVGSTKGIYRART